MSPREIDGDLVECPKCQWIHRPSQACPKSKPPTGPLRRPTSPPDPERSAEELTAGFRGWEAKAAEHPTVYTPTTRRCPGCGGAIFSAQNFLGAVFDVVGADHQYLEDHQTTCKAPVVQQVPDLRVPRRAGLPYRDDTDD